VLGFCGDSLLYVRACVQQHVYDLTNLLADGDNGVNPPINWQLLTLLLLRLEPQPVEIPAHARSLGMYEGVGGLRRASSTDMPAFELHACALHCISAVTRCGRAVAPRHRNSSFGYNSLPIQSAAHTSSPFQMCDFPNGGGLVCGLCMHGLCMI
jgi:hypothetical protein